MSAPPAYLDAREDAVHLDQSTQQYVWEGDDGEWEWHGPAPTADEERVSKGRWIKRIGEEEISKQQEVYSVKGVDENTPAAPVLKRHQGKKRKAEGEAPPKRPKRNTAVFVTQLPLDTEAHEVAEVFSRYGVLLEDDRGEPRVKLYHDESTGAFKGEALVVYFKPESVDLAVQLLDDTYLRASKGVCSGPCMHVEPAAFRQEGGGEEEKKEPKALSDADRKSIKKRMTKMNNKINDWDSDSGDEASQKLSQTARTLILKKMFTLAELDEDPTLLLDLKQDVREECASLGEVTNVVLWDVRAHANPA